MKLMLNAQDVLSCLEGVVSVAERKSHIQILTNVCIQASENRLSFTATDMEVECHSYLHLVNSEKIFVCVNAKRFFDIMKSMVEKKVTEVGLDFSDAKQVIVKGGRSRFVLPLLEGTEFPRFTTDAEKEVRLTLPFSKLIDSIKRVSFCASDNDVRQYLLGIKNEIKKDLFSCIATDGYRLALIDVKDIPVPNDMELDVIIPKKVCNELLRSQGKIDSGDFNYVINPGRYISLQFKNLSITSRLIEGRYPECRSLIPTNHPKVISVNREEFRNNLNQVAIMLSERFRIIIISLENNQLTMNTNNTEIDSAEVSMEVEYSGEPFRIGCNLSNLAEVFHSFDSDTVKMSFSSPDDKILIEYPDKESPQYIVMPSRIS